MHNSRVRARLPRNYLNFCRCWKLVLINSNFRRRRASRTRTTEHEFNKLNLTVHFADSTRAREREREKERGKNMYRDTRTERRVPRDFAC